MDGTKSKISSFLNSHQTIVSGTMWITFFALSSKLFGFIKQILIGVLFGISRATMLSLCGKKKLIQRIILQNCAIEGSC